MNVTIVIEAMILTGIMAAVLAPILEAPANALGPSGKCYIDCTGGGIPTNPREHNRCLLACVFGEGVQRLDEAIPPLKPQPSDRPTGLQTGQK